MPIEDNTPIKTEGFTFPTNTAFPVTHGDHEPGLSKREWFAGVALQGLCANPELIHIPIEKLAAMSTDHADAILDELAK